MLQIEKLTNSEDVMKFGESDSELRGNNTYTHRLREDIA